VLVFGAEEFQGGGGLCVDGALLEGHVVVLVAQQFPEEAADGALEAAQGTGAGGWG
jgi:hypothetical protein